MEKSSFFNAINRDRVYKAEDYANYFASFIGNGIFPNPSTNLQIISNNNMTITVKAGKAWINGYFYCNTDDLIVNIDVADGGLNRIDRLVLRLDFLNRSIKVKVKKGTFASSPVAPNLQRDADAYEMALGDIAISKGIISITQANVTDLRLNSNLCGVVHGTVDQVDTTTLFNQYLSWYQQATGKAEVDLYNLKTQFAVDFQAWFDSIKGQLSGDIAANLSNKINEINAVIGTETLNTNKKNLTGAINELKQNADSLTTQMGEKMNKKITDDATSKKYELGIKNGLLYYREVAP